MDHTYGCSKNNYCNLIISLCLWYVLSFSIIFEQMIPPTDNNENRQISSMRSGILLNNNLNNAFMRF